MIISLTAALTVTYGTTSIQAAHKKQNVSRPTESQHKPHLGPLDLKEQHLSAEILSMQRQIRESKRQEHDARAAAASERKRSKNHASSLPNDQKLRRQEHDARAADGNERKKPKDHASGLPNDRKLRRQEHDARAVAGTERKKPKDHSSDPPKDQKLKTIVEPDLQATTEDNWETLSLEDVQLSDLEQMDLTGLSPALLEHPTGAGVDYTESERRMMDALLQKNIDGK